MGKSAVSLKWHVGFENGMKMTSIFTIIFISKLEHAFLVGSLNGKLRQPTGQRQDVGGIVSMV